MLGALEKILPGSVLIITVIFFLLASKSWHIWWLRKPNFRTHRGGRGRLMQSCHPSQTNAFYEAHPWGWGSSEQPVLGGITEGKNSIPGREWDWVSTCLPKPPSAPFPIQRHQIKPTKGKTCPLVLTPFPYLGYIQCPTPHTLLLTAPVTWPGATTQEVDPYHMIVEINISTI